MEDVLYNQARLLASQLTPAEMLRLAGWLESMAATKLAEADQPPRPTRLKDLRGIWSDVHPRDAQRGWVVGREVGEKPSALKRSLYRKRRRENRVEMKRACG
jgi:hypothetical protein